jgi:predicted lipoprotein with Yx(FWY)xxD motif
MNPRRLISSSIAIALLAAIILVLALSGGSAARTRPTASRSTGELSTRHTPLGQILVDGGGRSLYLFEADKPNRSTLSAAGLKVWPAFAASRVPRAAGGVSAAHISLIRTNGGTQVAYFGHPLYYFVGDEMPGDTAGQGLREFGALWFAVSPSGRADTQAHAAAAAASAPAPTGYSY